LKTQQNDEIRKEVRKSYGEIAKSVEQGCCSGCCCGQGVDQTAEDVTVDLGYSEDDVSSVPEGANMGLGCGNPHAIASLKPGERVMDLGSGGGFDCFLAARAVGKTGHVIGVDMTPEMISRARGNAKKAEIENVEFRFGEIEAVPAEDDSVDVVMSNCVINLSPEKDKVFREAFRVLKKGGRLAVTDVVASVKLPEGMKKNMELYTGCVSGASPVEELKITLSEAGFVDIRIKALDESKKIMQNWMPGGKLEDYVFSATIEAIKP
jgi:SAM-dependent methyltransferase